MTPCNGSRSGRSIRRKSFSGNVCLSNPSRYDSLTYQIIAPEQKRSRLNPRAERPKVAGFFFDQSRHEAGAS